MLGVTPLLGKIKRKVVANFMFAYSARLLNSFCAKMHYHDFKGNLMFFSKIVRSRLISLWNGSHFQVFLIPFGKAELKVFVKVHRSCSYQGQTELQRVHQLKESSHSESTNLGVRVLWDHGLNRIRVSFYDARIETESTKARVLLSQSPLNFESI